MSGIKQVNKFKVSNLVFNIYYSCLPVSQIDKKTNMHHLL